MARAFHTFELGPVDFVADETKRTLGGISKRLVQISPPTNFQPEYLVDVLKDPDTGKNFRQMVSHFTRSTFIKRVMQNEVMTIWEVSSSEESVGSEQLDQTLEAIRHIVDAEDSSVQELQQSTYDAQNILFTKQEE